MLKIKKITLSYIKLLRPDHWFKNLVVFFGIGAALIYLDINLSLFELIERFFLIFFLASVISSVNYIINDITDEKGDAHHPIKKNRAIPSQRISKKILYTIIVILLLGSFSVSLYFFGYLETLALFALFVAGIFYNIRPLRFKDYPVIDVVTESVNNPVRILIGWFAVSKLPVFPPAVFLLLFWTLGAGLMSAKRYSELKFFTDRYPRKLSFRYRNSYRYYNLTNVFFMTGFYFLSTIILFYFFALKYKQKLLFGLPLLLIIFFWLVAIMVTDENKTLKDPEKFFVKKPVFSLISTIVFLILTALYFY